jgi:dTDP-4-amino-4,6-dideoxygalactose transaminase
MIARLPVISSGLRLHEIMLALLTDRRTEKAQFLAMLHGMTSADETVLTDSGISSFLLLLRSLRELSSRDEVVLPAYTAGSLVVAVRAAGLRPVLCDISLDDFNLDVSGLGGRVSSRTLAVVCVHMFGIGMRGLDRVRQQAPGAFLIEDCAQAMGSTVEGKTVGCRGDASIFSFNRGKNFPLVRGGCVCSSNGDIAGQMKKQSLLLDWERYDPWSTLAFHFAAKPLVYGAAYPLISRFRDTLPPAEIPLGAMDGFHVRCGALLSRRMPALFKARHDNGIALLDGLSGVPGLRLPRIDGGDRPVFNRVPVMFEDPSRREECRKKLWEAGIESSELYLKPLHLMFDLGYAPEEFPNARRFAQALLTLPCHPGCAARHIKKMIRVIRSCL